MYFGLFFFFFSLHEEANILSLGFISPTFSLKCAEEGGGPLKPNGTLLTPKCSYICGPFEEKRRTDGRRCRKVFRRGQRGLPDSLSCPARRLIIKLCIYTVVGANFSNSFKMSRSLSYYCIVFEKVYLKRWGCIKDKLYFCNLLCNSNMLVSPPN